MDAQVKIAQNKKVAFEEAARIVTGSNNQQLIRRVIISLGKNVRENKELVSIIKQLVSLLKEQAKQEFEQSYEKQAVIAMNKAVSIVERHPRWLDEHLYATEKQIFSHNDLMTMRKSVWRSAIPQEYNDAGFLI